MELNIGSNIFRNVDGIIKIEGKEQIVLQIAPEENRLLLTMDLYDTNGQHIAHLRKNVWAFNTKNRFDLQMSPVAPSLYSFPVSLHLKDNETGDVVFTAKLVEKNRLHIPEGRVFSHKGQLLEITPHCYRFPGKPRMFGGVQDLRGGTIAIG